MNLFKRIYTCYFCKVETNFFHHESEDKTAFFAQKSGWREYLKNRWICAKCSKERDEALKDVENF